MSNDISVDELLTVGYYQEKYEQERMRRLKLEDECDLLSVENLRLHEELKMLQSRLSKYENRNNNEALDKMPNQYDDLLVAGDNLFPNTISTQINSACDSKNVITMNYSHDGQFIYCAGADNSFHIYSLFNNFHWKITCTSPITCIQSYQYWVTCSLLDGSLVLLDLNTLPSIAISSSSSSTTTTTTTSSLSYGTDIIYEPVIEIYKDHTKANLSVQWSFDGSLLATTSKDKSTILYRFHPHDVTSTSTNTSRMHLIELKRFYFNNTPESILFTNQYQPPPSSALTTSTSTSTSTTSNAINCQPLVPSNDSKSSCEWTLIIGIRDECYLQYINCNTFITTKVSLNEKKWDTHASFTPLYLTLSPNHKYLLVATDKSQHIIYELGTNIRVRILAEHTCNEYSRPAVCWDVTGKYIYSNTDEEYMILVYELVTGRVTRKLHGHKGSIRSIVTCNPTAQTHNNNSSHNSNNHNSGDETSSYNSEEGNVNRMIASCSFDKSIIIWKYE